LQKEIQVYIAGKTHGLIAAIEIRVLVYDGTIVENTNRGN
jgi:hypothetical protein